VQVSVRKKPPGVNSFAAIGNIRKNVASIQSGGTPGRGGTVPGLRAASGGSSLPALSTGRHPALQRFSRYDMN